jgi:hypothetical protein
VEKALVKNSRFQTMVAGGSAVNTNSLGAGVLDLAAVGSPGDVTFIAVNTTTFKLQGSATNNGSDWADIAGSNMPNAGGNTYAVQAMSMFRSLIRYIKVVTDAGASATVIAICHNVRTSPQGAPWNLGWTEAANLQLLIDPQYGTYNANVQE